RRPDDVGTHLDMASAAEALDLLDLAVWLLEEVWEPGSPDLTVCRSLARLQEKRGNFKRAIRLWETVRKLDPLDDQAHHTARDPAATETIARGQYQQQVARQSLRSTTS